MKNHSDTKEDSQQQPSPVPPPTPEQTQPQPNQQQPSAHQQPGPYTQPQPGSYQQPVPYMPVQNPGDTTGIIGLVLNFFGISIGGIILGAISRNKSKAAGMSTTLGTVSLVWGIIVTAIVTLSILAIIFFAILGASVSQSEGSSGNYEFETHLDSNSASFDLN